MMGIAVATSGAIAKNATNATKWATLLVIAKKMLTDATDATVRRNTSWNNRENYSFLKIDSNKIVIFNEFRNWSHCS